MCCFVSEMNEWDTQNVIVTGHSDGVVRVGTRNHCLENKIYVSVVVVFREDMPRTKSSPAVLGSFT